jgi:hypothetical protein
VDVSWHGSHKGRSREWDGSQKGGSWEGTHKGRSREWDGPVDTNKAQYSNEIASFVRAASMKKGALMDEIEEEDRPAGSKQPKGIKDNGVAYVILLCGCLYIHTIHGTNTHIYIYISEYAYLVCRTKRESEWSNSSS